MNPTEAAYFAGFFDGEGCVAIYRHKYVVSLTNCDLRPLRRAEAIWGGYLSTQVAATRPGAVQDLWRWQIYGQHSRSFLLAIRPFVLVKAEQIDVYLDVLDVIPTDRGARRDHGVAEVIEQGAARLKLLKRGA